MLMFEVSAGKVVSRISLAEHGITAAARLQLSGAVKLKRAVARVQRAVRSLDGEERIAGQRHIERVVGLLQRPRFEVDKRVRPSSRRRSRTGLGRLHHAGCDLEDQALPPIPGRRGMDEVFGNDFLIARRGFHRAGTTI